jgi:hypothetical protein
MITIVVVLVLLVYGMGVDNLFRSVSSGVPAP